MGPEGEGQGEPGELQGRPERAVSKHRHAACHPAQGTDLAQRNPLGTHTPLGPEAAPGRRAPTEPGGVTRLASSRLPHGQARTESAPCTPLRALRVRVFKGKFDQETSELREDPTFMAAEPQGKPNDRIPSPAAKRRPPR